MSEANLDEVYQVLDVVYGGAAQPGDIRRAAQWLDEYLETPAAWNAAPALLAAARGGEPAHFYAAKVLHQKIEQQVRRAASVTLMRQNLTARSAFSTQTARPTLAVARSPL